MSELATRVKELIGKIGGMGCDCEGVFCEHVISLIEQALLAERRLAMEECARIARSFQVAVAPTTNVAEAIEYDILALRAAAEKEVVK